MLMFSKYFVSMLTFALISTKPKVQQRLMGMLLFCIYLVINNSIEGGKRLQEMSEKLHDLSSRDQEYLKRIKREYSLYLSRHFRLDPSVGPLLNRQTSILWLTHHTD